MTDQPQNNQDQIAPTRFNLINCNEKTSEQVNQQTIPIITDLYARSLDQERLQEVNCGPVCTTIPPLEYQQNPIKTTCPLGCIAVLGQIQDNSQWVLNRTVWNAENIHIQYKHQESSLLIRPESSQANDIWNTFQATNPGFSNTTQATILAAANMDQVGIKYLDESQNTFSNPKIYANEVENFLKRISYSQEHVKESDTYTNKKYNLCSNNKTKNLQKEDLADKKLKTKKQIIKEKIENSPKSKKKKSYKIEKIKKQLKLVENENTTRITTKKITVNKIEKLKKQLELVENEISKRKVELMTKEKEIKEELQAKSKYQQFVQETYFPSPKRPKIISDDKQIIKTKYKIERSPSPKSKYIILKKLFGNNETKPNKSKNRKKIKSVVTVPKKDNKTEIKRIKKVTRNKSDQSASNFKHNDDTKINIEFKDRSETAHNNELSVMIKRGNDKGNLLLSQTSSDAEKVRFAPETNATFELTIRLIQKTSESFSQNDKNENSNDEESSNEVENENCSSTDLSFLDEIDVDAIVEMLNTSDEQENINKYDHKSKSPTYTPLKLNLNSQPQNNQQPDKFKDFDNLQVNKPAYKETIELRPNQLRSENENYDEFGEIMTLLHSLQKDDSEDKPQSKNVSFNSCFEDNDVESDMGIFKELRDYEDQNHANSEDQQLADILSINGEERNSGNPIISDKGLENNVVEISSECDCNYTNLAEIKRIRTNKSCSERDEKIVEISKQQDILVEKNVKKRNSGLTLHSRNLEKETVITIEKTTNKQHNKVQNFLEFQKTKEIVAPEKLLPISADLDTERPMNISIMEDVTQKIHYGNFNGTLKSELNEKFEDTMNLQTMENNANKILDINKKDKNALSKLNCKEDKTSENINIEVNNSEITERENKTECENKIGMSTADTIVSEKSSEPSVGSESKDCLNIPETEIVKCEQRICVRKDLIEVDHDVEAAINHLDTKSKIDNNTNLIRGEINKKSMTEVEVVNAATTSEPQMSATKLKTKEENLGNPKENNKACLATLQIETNTTARITEPSRDQNTKNDGISVSRPDNTMKKTEKSGPSETVRTNNTKVSIKEKTNLKTGKKLMEIRLLKTIKKPEKQLTKNRSLPNKQNKVELFTQKGQAFENEFLARSIENKIFVVHQKRYTVGSIIHDGHFSKIFICEDEEGEPLVAKILRKGISTFKAGLAKQEMLGAILHEYGESASVINLATAMPVAGRWCFLFEYYPKSLKQVLWETNHSFRIDAVQTFTRQLLAALLFLRKHLHVHMTINPDHILVNMKANKLKVCGFDETCHIDRVMIEAWPDLSGINYRAPEVILGYQMGYAADVWSAALVIHEMATNTKLFPQATANDVLFQQIRTLGSVPAHMKTQSSFFKHFYNGNCFIKSLTNSYQVRYIKGVDKYHRTSKMRNMVFQAYERDWGRMNHVGSVLHTQHKLKQLASLLDDMLVVDPERRTTIEFAVADPFIYDYEFNKFIF